MGVGWGAKGSERKERRLLGVEVYTRLASKAAFVHHASSATWSLSCGVFSRPPSLRHTLTTMYFPCAACSSLVLVCIVTERCGTCR